MARPSLFTAYNLERKNRHTLTRPAGPVKIVNHRLRAEEWRVSKEAKGTRGSARLVEKRGTKKTKEVVKEAPLPRPSTILRASSADIARFARLQCDTRGSEPDCGPKCYTAFRKRLADNRVDIRGPGPLGYAAFTKRGVSLRKNEYIGEYLGELRPLPLRPSLYAFEIEGACSVDAEHAANWTRYVNSSCRPNVKASTW